MSRSTQKVFELIPGVHLVAVTKVLPCPIPSPFPRLRITFTESRVTKSAEVDFNINKPEFIKLCKDLDVSINGMNERSLLGKRLWLCIDEEFVMNGTEKVSSEICVLKFVKCTDSTKPPKFKPAGIYRQEDSNWAGSKALFFTDPDGTIVQERSFSNKMEAAGFTHDVIGGINQVTGIPSEGFFNKEEKNKRLEEARKIIAEGEKKDMASLNQKNKPKEEDWSL